MPCSVKRESSNGAAAAADSAGRLRFTFQPERRSTAVHDWRLTIQGYSPVHALSSSSMLTVGAEWLVEASGCDAEALGDVERLREVFARAVAELGLSVVGEPLWHKFPGPGGVTGLAMLTESHLACHTYPEYRLAAFNLYCCRERAPWDWDARLRELLGAEEVRVRHLTREFAPRAAGHVSPPEAARGGGA